MTDAVIIYVGAPVALATLGILGVWIRHRRRPRNPTIEAWYRERRRDDPGRR